MFLAQKGTREGNRPQFKHRRTEMLIRVLVALVLCTMIFVAGWISALYKYSPGPQPDNRTALQKQLFRFGSSKRVFFGKDGSRGIEAQTDCSGNVYLKAWERFGEDMEEFTADSQGRLREHRKTLDYGNWPRKTILNDNVVESIEYKEKPSGYAKADWDVLVLPTQVTASGIDGRRYQEEFDGLVRLLTDNPEI